MQFVARMEAREAALKEVADYLNAICTHPDCVLLDGRHLVHPRWECSSSMAAFVDYLEEYSELPEVKGG